MKMQVGENLAMESGTTFTNRRGYTISSTTLVLLVAFFICSVIAVGFLVYNFAVCPSIPITQANICDHIHPTVAPHNASHELLDTHIQKDSSSSLSNNIYHPKEPVDKDVRLPRSVVPIAYDIKLIPFLFENNFTFHGDVKIITRIVEDCYNITLHAADMVIYKEDVTVRQLDTNPANIRNISIKKQFFVEPKQFFVLEFHETLTKNSTYEITMKYSGFLMDFLQGFYRSSYTQNNEKRWIASTQFQPTDARRAFPCFDEPALKAKFNISIARHRNMTSISNMPKIAGESKSVEGISDYVWDVYEESLPMSTYLVAFVISDFKFKKNGNFSVWAPADSIKSADYALEVGPKILKFLEEFFGIPFPLPKIDMIALPDFHAGAMENWGLITYRETAMLYEEGVSASANKQRVATVVSHELAHQWFGNLVTPSWWSDIWLNEGFASYMEYLGVDAIEPAWKPMDQFVVNELQNVFTLDALSSSHKISIEVDNPDEINEIFDRISYGKGAAIIRMMSHFLTSEVFRKGLTNYLKQMSYESAEQDDLWNFLTREAHKYGIFDKTTSVKQIMDTWTLQTGFPVITITRSTKPNTLNVQQDRFAYKKLNQNETENLWWIPLTFTTNKELDFENTRPTAWLKQNKTIEIEDPKIVSAEWLIFNIQQTGYYRVQYDEANWKSIISHLRDPKRFQQIAPSNRAQLIDDALNLARAGLLSYQTAFDLTLYLEHETEYVPWKSAITAFNTIDSMFIKDGDYYLIKKYMLHLLDMVYKQVGFDDTDDSDMLTTYKRIDILTTACHLGYRPCIQKCNQLFHNWMVDPNPDINNPISPNLRNLVYCTAIKYGTETEWDFALERFAKTKVSSEKEVILTALGCSRETWILNRYLKKSIDGVDHIRKQDVFRVFAAVSNNVIGQPIAFNYIRKHWQEMKDYLGSAMTNLNLIVKYSTQRMNTKFELDELKSFINRHYKESSRTIDQAIERVEVSISWMERNYRPIVEWLRKEIEE